MTILRIFIALLAVVAPVAAGAGCSSTRSDASLTVQNLSDFTMVEIHVTPVGNASWGPNLLGNQPLEPGESLVLGVSCDTYDALLVDETGTDCEVHDVDLCLNDAHWIIRNNTCTVFGAAKAAREAAAAAKSRTPAAANAPNALDASAP